LAGVWLSQCEKITLNMPLKGGLKTGAEFLHAHARARLFVLFFWRRKKIGRQSGETDGRSNNQSTQSEHAKI
jgi:hypothetical protein